MIEYDYYTTHVSSRWALTQKNKGPYFRGSVLRWLPMEWQLMYQSIQVPYPVEHWTISYHEDGVEQGHHRLPYNWCFV